MQLLEGHSTSATWSCRLAWSRRRCSRTSATSPSRARFAFVANGGEPEVVVAGNERVLEGRLADAHFTFERDVAKGIEALAGELGAITFVAGAGTFADKAARLQALVEERGGGEVSREAARLAKADQAAELVREFPDLEGHVGAEYARLARFPRAFAPRSRSSISPTRGRAAPAHRARGGCWPPPRRSTTSRSPTRWASVRPGRATGLAEPRSASAGSRSRRAANRRGRPRSARPRPPRPAGGRPARRPVRRGRLRLRAARGHPRSPGRVRAGRPGYGSVLELQTLADLARTLAAEAPSQDSSGPTSPSTARTAWRGADGAAGALDPALATDAAQALIEALGEGLAAHRCSHRRARLPGGLIAAAASSGPPESTFFGRSPRDGRRTNAFAPTGSACSSTCATRSGRSATSRRSPGRSLRWPIPSSCTLSRTRPGDRGASRRRRRGAVPGPGVPGPYATRIAGVEDVHLAAQRARGRRAVVIFTLVEPEMRG